MRPFTLLLALVFASSSAFPSAVFAAETTTDPPGIMRSGLAAVQRLSETSDTTAMAQAQQTKLKKIDRKTKIILIAVVAAAAVIWIEYKLHHDGFYLGPLTT